MVELREQYIAGNEISVEEALELDRQRRNLELASCYTVLVDAPGANGERPLKPNGEYETSRIPSSGVPNAVAVGFGDPAELGVRPARNL